MSDHGAGVDIEEVEERIVEINAFEVERRVEDWLVEAKQIFLVEEGGEALESWQGVEDDEESFLTEAS